MADLGELVFFQLGYIAILFLIIRTSKRQGRKALFYWIVVALYALTIILLVHEFINMPKTGNGGYAFAIGMYSIIVPGLLILISTIVFVVTQLIKRSG